MNRIKNILLLILSSYCSIAYSQDIELGIQTGIGTYNMKDLKGLNEVFFKSLPFQVKMISNYPSYFYYKPTFLLSFNKFRIGLQASYYSTGSRISSKDYSGEYLYDTRINCIAPSVYGDFSLFQLFGKCKVMLYSEGGVTFSQLSLKEDLTVDNENLTNSSYAFKSRNYYIEPGLKLEYQLSKLMNIGLDAGYFAQFGKNDFVSDKNEVLNNRNETIGPDWSGLRVGLSLSVSLPHKKVTM